MKGSSATETRRRALALGFSLVEVTLAILVVGIGLLTAFSLFPAGLAMNRRSIGETRAAMFAEEVFNGYRVQVDGSSNTWTKLGPPYSDDPVLEAAAGGMWTNWGAGIVIKATATPLTVRYYDWGGVLQYAFRYTLDFGSLSPSPDNRVKYARLKVWNGEFGPTNEVVDFYTEFYNYAMPP